VKQISVLLVEDHEPMRYSTGRILELAGFRVVACADHGEALPIIEGGGKLDLMVTDIVMPGAVNGFALARIATLKRPRLKVVYMTGHYADLPPVEVRNALGVILSKPFEAKQLLAAVTASLEGQLGLVA
jgi:CheY-like chemotaxis protein